MRKTMIAIALGLTALAAAACGNSGSSPASSGALETVAPVESMDAGASPSDMLESPSDAVESPSAS